MGGRYSGNRFFISRIIPDSLLVDVYLPGDLCYVRIIVVLRMLLCGMYVRWSLLVVHLHHRSLYIIRGATWPNGYTPALASTCYTVSESSRAIDEGDIRLEHLVDYNKLPLGESDVQLKTEM